MRRSPSGAASSVGTTFDRFRGSVPHGLQDLQHRCPAFLLLAFGAGLASLLAGPARAALVMAPTDGPDTQPMPVRAALVLLMTPGLAFFHGGFTRCRNVLNCRMMSSFLTGLIGGLWVVIGCSLAVFSGFGSPCIGGLGGMVLHGLGGQPGDQPLAAGFPISAGSIALFQGMFAIFTPAVFSGALLERIKAAIPSDVSLDTFMVHGVIGTTGALLSGLLARKIFVPADYFPLSAKIMEESGNFWLFLTQLKAALITYGFVALGTAIVLWILGALMPLRVGAEDEERGLDFVSHGAEACPTP